MRKLVRVGSALLIAAAMVAGTAGVADAKAKKIGKSLVANATELKTKMTEALDTFKAADPNGVAFSGDVTIFSVAIQTIAVGLSDPFSKITDQDLIGAFADTKSCKNVVTIIG